MKNTLIISLLILTTAVFGQRETEVSSSLQNVVFKNNQSPEKLIKNEETKPKVFNLFTDINFISTDIKMNTERRFELLQPLQENKKVVVQLNENLNNKNYDKNIHLATDTKQKFVEKIIYDKLMLELMKSAIQNEAFEYGDKNLAVFKEYEALKNKLIVNYSVNNDLDVQIGKSLYPYLNKILKTELDKTLENSLNLLVINF